MKTYLIARGKIEDRTHKKGIDSIISLDYMGASEYEWGALPHSLDLIRIYIKEYVYFNLDVKGTIITIFCKASQKDSVAEYLDLLSQGKMHTKCGSYFDSVIQKDEFYPRSTNKCNFWWDIENHLMFWIKNDEFENKFKVLILNKPSDESDK